MTTTLNQKTLLPKTKQDVETFMDEYEMDSCYKTKIMNSIEECFNCCGGDSIPAGWREAFNIGFNVLKKLWVALLKIFDFESEKDWWNFDWSNMTKEENIENGLNIIFWIFRQIAVNFLLYLFSLLFNEEFKMTAMGSSTVTSDYDISISSDNSSADFTRIFNYFFFRIIRQTSGIIFDTNIYAHPIVEYIEHKESNNCYYNYHKNFRNFLKAPKFSKAFLQQEDRIAAILMYYKYFSTTLINKEGKLEYITYKFLKKNFRKELDKAEKKYKRLKEDRGFEDGQITNIQFQNVMNENYENVAGEIQDIKKKMDHKKCIVYEKQNDVDNIITELLNKMTELQFFGNETLLSVSAFIHVVVYLQEMCTDHVFSICRKTIINKKNAKFIYLNSFIENLCFMTTHFKDINEKGLKKIMKYLYRTCDALVEYLKNVKKTPTEKLITIHKIAKQWQQNKNKGEPEKMTENVKKLEKLIMTKQKLKHADNSTENKIKAQVNFLMDVFQDNQDNVNLPISNSTGGNNIKKIKIHIIKKKQPGKKTLAPIIRLNKVLLQKEISGGKKKKVIRKNKKKKVRKHQGISQTGGNIGKLKKGFRYSGKKLKSGLPQIIKCKQTNKSKK
jgi:hypothetical protein